MMSIFRKLMPREDRFFDMFSKHSETVIKAAEALDQLLSGIDVEKNWPGKYKVRASAGSRPGSVDWRVLLREAVANGAGEVLLTSVEREGTLKGMDLALIEEASGLIEVPLVAAGGAGSLADVSAAVAAGANAVAAGAFFVFHGPHRAVLITYPRYDELKALWQAG